MGAISEVYVIPRRRFGSERSRQRVLVVVLSVLSAITVAPFLGMALIALSPSEEPAFPLGWPSHLTFENLAYVLSVGSFGQWFLNSMIFAGTSVLLVLLTATMAGYALAKKRFPGRNVVLWSIIATFMVPMQAVLIPLFILLGQFGGINTLWGMIIPTLANAQAVFLMRQFILDLPDEVFDAARIDGAGEWRTFVAIVLPLVRPVLATLGIFVFLWHWNDLLWPLIVGQSDAARTLTVGLSTLNGESGGSPQLVMSAALISVIPCLLAFIFMQRYIVEGIATTGVKG